MIKAQPYFGKTVIDCSFCSKSRKEVARLITNDSGSSICDECLVVAFALMIESPVKFAKPSVPSGEFISPGDSEGCKKCGSLDCPMHRCLQDPDNQVNWKHPRSNA